MPISCLADELLDLTFKYLSGDRASLVAAALVSRNFLQVSQRTLYTAYRIKLPLEQSTRTTSASTRAFKQTQHPSGLPLTKSIERNPSIGPCIRTLVIGTTLHQGSQLDSSALGHFRRALSSLYAQLVNLERLEFNGPEGRNLKWQDLPTRMEVGTQRVYVGQVLPITHLALTNVTDVPLWWFETFTRLDVLLLEEVEFKGEPKNRKKVGKAQQLREKHMTSLKRLNIQLGVKQIGNFVDWITTCPVISLVQLEEVMCKQSRWALNANDNYYQLHCEFRKKAAELLHRQLPHLTKLALQHNDYAVLPSEWPDLSMFSALETLGVLLDLQAVLEEAQDTTAELQEWFKGLNSQNLQMVQLNCWFRNWTNPSPDDRAIWPEVATLLEDLVLWLSERAWVVHLKIATFKFASEPPETKKSELAELFPRLSDRTNRLKVEFVAPIDFRDVYPDHTSFFVI